jgi:hypothetical protein
MSHDFDNGQDQDPGIDCSDWKLTIHDYKDHPQLKGGEHKTIYLLEDEFYLATTTQLTKIDIDRIEYTNMGEPYRELARIYFTHLSSSRNDSIDVNIEDIADLYLYCNTTGYELSTDKKLIEHKNFIAEIDLLCSQ